MPRRTFKDLLNEFPRAHLIVGHVESLNATAAAETVIGRQASRGSPNEG
ncbi:MAG TPA: hypothetical protein VGJ56_00755 [Reyranella sp.]|jgi:hypothetical protein